MISYERQERSAVGLIGFFISVWCDRGSDSEPFFNCGNCEFQTDDGRCLAKIFAHVNHNQAEAENERLVRKAVEYEKDTNR